jgi:hypothetical protein
MRVLRLHWPARAKVGERDLAPRVSPRPRTPTPAFSQTSSLEESYPKLLVPVIRPGRDSETTGEAVLLLAQFTATLGQSGQRFLD